MRKKVTAVLLAGAFALSVPAAAVASQTGDPHAGESGHFKGGSKPCKVGGAAPKCPPQND
jgi:Spy/CpxP family protein refolding chaperone